MPGIGAIYCHINTWDYDKVDARLRVGASYYRK
jgi:hypothetical protein